MSYDYDIWFILYELILSSIYNIVDHYFPALKVVST
jgi:hypothetical protein